MGRQGNVIALKTTSFICLALSWSRPPLRHTGGQVKANSYVCEKTLFYCSTAYRTGTEHFCVSTLSHVIRFSIPIVMTAVHAAASLWLGHGAHSISIHVVPNLIASCSAFRGSIIPKDPCSGCKVGLLSFQYCSSFKAFVTQYSRHICVSLPVFPF